MVETSELRDLDTHFAFGENWSSYAELIDEKRISSAVSALERLVSRDDAAEARFLDIGCGSGLHSVAATHLGVATLLACDLDPVAVATTEAVLERHAKGVDWSVRQISVFDLEAAAIGEFDIVYSWGVLHHSGEIEAALRAAAARVRPGGLIVFALYRRTWFDRFWRLEKRWYSNASPAAQKAARTIYDIVNRLAHRLAGRSIERDRGMDYWHDVHDWLGGYPYETILASEVHSLMQSMKFSKVLVYARGRSLGLLGSGCDEYVYRSAPAQNS